MQARYNTPVNALRPKVLLYQVAQEEIKNFIIQNHLKPGDSLPPETEFVRLLGVSRTSVREAVKSLETLGIIEARPGAGLFVKSFSFDPIIDNMAYGLMFGIKDLAELLEVRFHLEHGMIDKAVDLLTAPQLQRLKEILQRMEHDAKAGRYSADDDRLFHQALWENVDNSMLQKVLDIFWMCFYQARKRIELPEPSDLMDTFYRHKSIVNALELKDLASARDSIAHHYVGIQRRLANMQQPMMDATGTHS